MTAAAGKQGGGKRRGGAGDGCRGRSGRRYATAEDLRAWGLGARKPPSNDPAIEKRRAAGRAKWARHWAKRKSMIAAGLDPTMDSVFKIARKVAAEALIPYKLAIVAVGVVLNAMMRALGKERRDVVVRAFGTLYVRRLGTVVSARAMEEIGLTPAEARAARQRALRRRRNGAVTVSYEPSERVRRLMNDSPVRHRQSRLRINKAIAEKHGGIRVVNRKHKAARRRAEEQRRYRLGKVYVGRNELGIRTYRALKQGEDLTELRKARRRRVTNARNKVRRQQAAEQRREEERTRERTRVKRKYVRRSQVRAEP